MYRAIERSITFGVQSYTNNIHKNNCAYMHLCINTSIHLSIGSIDSVERYLVDR